MDSSPSSERTYQARAPEYDRVVAAARPLRPRAGIGRGMGSGGCTGGSCTRDLGATGDVLELAGGTGWWTARLARTAGHLTVIDSSPESLELNRKRVGRPDVEYLVADLITWQPARGPMRSFLLLLALSRATARIRASRRWCGPSRTGGRVFLIDNRNESPDPYVVRRDQDLELRRVHDGREFQVVEVFYEPEELQSLLGDEGWTARLDATRWFIFGEACPAL